MFLLQYWYSFCMLHRLMLFSCFADRYGSADLCRDHVNLLVELIKQSPMFPLQSPLLSVVVRLIKSLAPEDQVLSLKQNYQTYSTSN